MTRRRKGDHGVGRPDGAPPASKRVRKVKSIGPPPASDVAPAGVADRIRSLEERLDRMIDEHARDRNSVVALEPAPTALVLPSLSSIPAPPVSSIPPAANATDGADGVDGDEFGYDPAYEQKVLPFFELLYEKYFRAELHGVENIPSEGRCLLVGNHSGTVPLDGVMLRIAVRREHPRRREVRWLAEDAIFHFPFLGSFTNRLGAVRACQENAERLLDQGALVAVFPEGTKGIGKLFKNRYRLQRFGRGGFVKLALRTQTPVVPVAIVGGEEMNPLLLRLEGLTKTLGIPYLPVTPTFPLLGPLGLIPAPTKWKILIGEPVELDGFGAEAAEDEILVIKLTERVRAIIQSMLDRTLAVRRSVWFG